MNKGKQNQFQFLLLDTFGYGRTGLTPTVKISKDGGAFAVTTNTATQVSAADAPGLYNVVLTASECNCDVMSIAVTLASGDMPAVIAQVEFEDLANEVLSSPADEGEFNNLRNLCRAGMAPWSIANNTLTIKDANGDTTGEFQISTDAIGNITGASLP